MTNRRYRQRALAAVADRSGFWSTHRLATHLGLSDCDGADTVAALSIQGLVQARSGRLHITDNGQLIASRGDTVPPSLHPSKQPSPPPTSPPAVDRAEQFAAAVLSRPGRPRSAYADMLGWSTANAFYPAERALLLGLIRGVGIGINTLYHPPRPPPTSPPPEIPMASGSPQHSRHTQVETDAAVLAAVQQEPEQPYTHYADKLQLPRLVVAASLRRLSKRREVHCLGRRDPAVWAPGSRPGRLATRRAELCLQLEATPGKTVKELEQLLGWANQTVRNHLNKLRRKEEVTTRDTSSPLRFWLDGNDEDGQNQGPVATASTPEPVESQGSSESEPTPERPIGAAPPYVEVSVRKEVLEAASGLSTEDREALQDRSPFVPTFRKMTPPEAAAPEVQARIDTLRSPAQVDRQIAEARQRLAQEQIQAAVDRVAAAEMEVARARAGLEALLEVHAESAADADR